MKPTIIEVSQVSKRFSLEKKTPHYRTLRDHIANPFQRKKHNPSENILWALRDVSFSIEDGQVFGIIGPNGSGKSTLLKILSHILAPTEGKLRIQGKVTSLLEVGAGFHPELTGRENIFLNGSILGMKRVEIKKKFDEIVAFSGLEDFIDSAVKFYSSGMYVRLGFAVAAHLDPEILILDEALAVGDMAFQQRSLVKVREMTGSGRTVVIVSHQMDTILRYAKNCILLKQGKIISHGPAKEVVDRYLGSHFSNSPTASFEEDLTLPAQVTHFSLRNLNGDLKKHFLLDEIICTDLEFSVREEKFPCHVGFSLSRLNGPTVCSYSSRTDQHHSEWSRGSHRVRLKFPGGLLNIGAYSIRAWLEKADEELIDCPLDSGLQLEIKPIDLEKEYLSGMGGEGILSVTPTFQHLDSH
jgi:lipopolysaccharide transport system ATP-binding protein